MTTSQLTPEPVHLTGKFALIADHWNPRIAARCKADCGFVGAGKDATFAGCLVPAFFRRKSDRLLIVNPLVAGEKA